MSTSNSDRWTAWATELVHQLYGSDGLLSPLPGELDLNFIVRVNGTPQQILKVMRPDCWTPLVDMQIKALAHINAKAPEPALARVLTTTTGEPFATCTDPDGESRLVWSTSYLPGTLYCRAQPRPIALLNALGRLLAHVANGLADFEHPALDRNLKWDLRRANWIDPHLDDIAETDDRRHIERIMRDYRGSVSSALAQLPSTAIHNDANDHNVLVDVGDPAAPKLTGLIDFGDMVRAPVVCDLAIAGAYAVLERDRPFDALCALVKGYHAVRPLTEAEIALVYPLVLTRLAVSVTNAAITKKLKPDDPYVTVTEAPAWAFLRRTRRVHADWIEGLLRTALSLGVVEEADVTIDEITSASGTYAPILPVELANARILDLGVDGQDAPQDPFQLTNAPLAPGEVALGRYREPRLVYNAPEFALGPHRISDHRTVHIGVDVFADAGTEVRAPTDASVCSVAYNPAAGDYGGVVVLGHRTKSGHRFYSLYGHLAKEVVERLRPGQTLNAGEAFARLGAEEENGGWPPHLHLQLSLRPFAPAHDWPGVVDPDELETGEAMFPNPAALLNLTDDVTLTPLPTIESLVERRQNHLGAVLRTSYTNPVLVVRGWRHYLFDALGRTYLDAYNNVPHVGHSHPRLSAAVSRQIRMLNTNTRYLHPARAAYVEALAALLPASLDTCFLLSSASEANELALRLARAHTGAKQVITVDAGYHGHTISAIDISAYKFNGPGGEGPPPWVHVVPVADPYRGPHRGLSTQTGRAYAHDVAAAVARIHAAGDELSAFICEPFPSVGGQIVPPDGYLAAVYDIVRKANGVCIADEVQTGLGRLGQHFWGFEQQGAVPDIVVLGKPLGNGYPLAAVVTTKAIAASFDNGMEFFSTFGGSTLACVVGLEVLKIIQDEDLTGHVERTGGHLLDRLRGLMPQHPIIGDVRGMGFFIGVDLVRDRDTRTPATDAARYVVDRLRDQRILIGRDGPDANVLKIRPPLTFGSADVDLLVDTLDAVLQEAPVSRME